MTKLNVMSPWFRSSNDKQGASDDDGGHKYEQIQQACQDQTVDKLRGFATSEGGLLDDELRRKACMTPPIFAVEDLS